MTIIGTAAASRRRTPTGRSLSAIGWITSALVAISTWAATPSRAQPPPAEKQAAAPLPANKVANEAAARAEAIKTATPIFRSIIEAELRFIRAASGASDEQARRMTREARGVLKSAVARYAEMALMALKARWENNHTEVDWNGVYLPLRRDLISIAKGQLLPEQWTRFQDEVARRDEFRKRLVVRSLLVRLDARLALTADQLDKIGGSLRSHWDPQWESEDIFNDHNAPFPELPDSIIVPLLTGAQQAAWKKLDKKAVGAGNRPSAPLMLEFEVGALMAEGMPAGDDIDADAAPKR